MSYRTCQPNETRWRSVAPGDEPVSARGQQLLQTSLRGHQPLGKLLDGAAQTGEPVLLLVNDGYRATRTRAALEALAALTAQRPPAPRFRALIATGTHQINPKERRSFEAKTFDGCGLQLNEIAWHDADDAGQLVEVAGIELHAWVAQSRFLLPIGSVEPHYFAGLTGPHKTVTIGVLSRKFIERNHARAVEGSAGPFCLQGNPVSDGIVDMLRALQGAGRTVIAIAEVVRDEEILAVSVGDPWQTVLDLQDVVRRVYTYELDRPVDVLRLRVPLPLGRSFYQADKALRNNHTAVRDRGGIILEAACPEGVGQDAFLSLLRRAADHRTALQIIRRDGYRLGDHKAVNLRHLTDPLQRGVHVAVVGSRISRPDADVLGIHQFGTTAKALAWLHSVVQGPIEHGLIIEDAGNLCTVRPLQGRRV